ncbi:hypothetical protein BpHYR1_034215, partial [Brachionus plicatilis]
MMIFFSSFSNFGFVAIDQLGLKFFLQNDSANTDFIHNKPFDNSKKMNSLFEKILDFKLNDSIMKNLKESYIDLSALIDLTETDMTQFGITLGGNNMKNDLNKINSFVKEVQGGNGLENFVIEKLV